MKGAAFATLLLASSARALAQEHEHDAAPETPTQSQPDSAEPHAGHNMGFTPDAEIFVGNEPAPAPPSDHAADAVWGAGPMAESRHQLARENGDFTGSMLLVDLFEYQARSGRDGYRFEGEGWIGGDINRVVVKAEGEGERGESFGNIEAQLLYSRAIDPWFNVQAGIRHDFRPRPQRTYAVLGFEGLAPYWLKVEGALFLSEKGDLLARFEGSYDQRISQRLILQPRAELNFAAQDVTETGVGSGLSDLELGLRLRYEIIPEFAPYVGVEWAKSFGATAGLGRVRGEDPDVGNVVVGIRFWF